MALAQRVPISMLDYLEYEATSPTRHEYVAGQVFAMTGGTLRHNRIALNLASALLRQLDGTPCRVFINDAKLKVEASGAIYYPDVLVHCSGGPLAGSETVLNDATLVAEVTSDSTAGTDRREKRIAYKQLPGLRSYWVISQDEMKLDVHLREADGSWSLHVFRDPAEALSAEGVAQEFVTLGGLYAGTDVARG